MNILTNYFKGSLLLICFSLFSSCIITRTPGFYSGYNRLPKELKSRVVFVNEINSLPLLIDSNTYAITAKHLVKSLKKTERCIVYFWAPSCTGSACISIPAFENFCKSNGYRAIVVSEYYDFEQLSIQGVKPSRVFAVNHKHYGTDYCNKYLRKFQQSLFELFGASYNSKSFNKYLYYDGQTISNSKPANLKYPWR